MAVYRSAKGSLEYTVVGNPTIENGIVSNFTNNDYLLVPFTTAIGTADFEMKTAVTVDKGSAIYKFFGGSTSAVEKFTGLYWGRSNIIGAGIIINNTFYRLTSSTKSVGTKYYVILYRKGTTFGLKISTDNINFDEEYTRTVPEGDITLDGGNTFSIGSSGNTYALNGSIDLNETYVAVNGRPWFGVYPVAVQKHQVIGPVGYTVVGSPTIVDGVVSGFSQSNYLKTTENRPTTNLAEYNIKFTTSTLGAIQKLCGVQNQYPGIYLREDGRLHFISFSYGNTHDYIFDQCVVQANTTYTVNMLFDEGTVTCKLYDSNSQIIASQSKRGSWWDDAFRYPYVFGKGAGEEDGYWVFNGSIDLNETYIKYNGELWFYQPMETKYIVKDDKLVWADPRIYIDDSGTKTYATQYIAPVPAGYTFGNTTTPSIGYVDIPTQVFTPAPEGSIIGRDE